MFFGHIAKRNSNCYYYCYKNHLLKKFTSLERKQQTYLKRYICVEKELKCRKKYCIRIVTEIMKKQ